ncbi:RHS repeat domain-containing protein, partial [Aeromonas cavernicola]|uniref:RHS repeat domain-containing protein n=1 Tax=Aeromonas cavernicola TaxID=1006623 RepID=UPI0012FDEC0D
HPGLHLVSRRTNPDGSELENEQGERHHIHYYPNGLIASETGFDGRTTAYRYDLTGQLLEKSELGEQGGELITRYQRDAMGRLIQKTLPDGLMPVS